MINITKSNNRNSRITSNSRQNMPLLTRKKIIRLLIHAIKSYQRHEISLEALTQIASEIKRQKQVPLSDNLRNNADEIQSLSVVNEVLKDILSELSEEKVE